MVTALIAALLLAAPAVDDDRLPDGYQPKVIRHAPGPSAGDGGGVLGRQTDANILGIETLPSFSSWFYEPGLVPTSLGPFPQFTWPYTMVGRPPFGSGASGDTTVINAPIVPVIVDLRNADGSPRFAVLPDGSQGPRMILDASRYLTPVLQSPVFQSSRYGSSQRPTQFTDAVHRAQFFNVADGGWHTLLHPVVKPARTMVLIRGTYRFATDATGHLVFVLVDEAAFSSALFPPTPSDTATVMGAAENAGDVTATDLSTFLFPDTYLYQGGDPNNCCVLGFHSYDVEPGGAANGFREKHYVMAYASWLTPGILGGGFQDVTALSHELAEIFSDPFVSNATPIWRSPDGLCQNNLESGDVLEGLPGATFPVTLGGVTYHPQNEALLQWFAGQAPSTAFQHAYSFPDTTLLTSAAVPMNADCSAPATFPAARGDPPAVVRR